MKRKDIQSTLKTITKDIESILDDKAKPMLSALLNLVETLATDLASAQTTIQRQADKINKLQGEQGKPNIRKQKNNDKDNNDTNNGNHSSENERKGTEISKKKKRGKKNINIDRQIVCTLSKNDLPADIEFKGYEPTIIQDIIIKTDNIEFRREVYYSPSLKKTFIAHLPDGYSGEFGPGIRALTLSLYHDSKMTEPAIKRYFDAFSIQISKASISRMLTDKHEPFHQEKEEVIIAGLCSTPYHNIDDTSARVNGKNYYTHVLCNPFYTAYFTVPKKDRITVLEILCREKLKFIFNSESFQLMRALGLPEQHLSTLRNIVPSTVTTRAQIDEILELLFPSSKKKKQKKNRKIILESAAIIFYKSSPYAIEHLVCDNAPQFNHITKHKALCWVHEGRHYKKLNPIVPLHKTILDKFIDAFWEFYRALLGYKAYPSTEKALQLSERFDEIFTEKTGYEQLDDRIAKTYANKPALLLVLEFHFLPLHNNTAELGARYQARHRDINLQTKNKKGTDAKDTFATIVQTARKLKVTFFDYIKDRISKKYEMPSLASLISQKSQTITDITDTS